MDDDTTPPRHEGREERAERLGRESRERDGPWHDNPYTPGTREWFAFDDARQGRD